MSEKGIIASWMSPVRLFNFTVGNQMMNITFLSFKYLLSVLNGRKVATDYFRISEEVEMFFSYFFRGYGMFTAVLGFSLIILSRVGKAGGIDGKRTFYLLILGVINVIESFYCTMEVLL